MDDGGPGLLLARRLTGTIRRVGARRPVIGQCGLRGVGALMGRRQRRAGLLARGQGGLVAGAGRGHSAAGAGQ